MIGCLCPLGVIQFLSFSFLTPLCIAFLKGEFAEMAALHRSEVEGLLTKAALRASALQEAQRAVLRTAEETKVIPRTSPGAHCTATQHIQVRTAYSSPAHAPDGALQGPQRV